MWRPIVSSRPIRARFGRASTGGGSPDSTNEGDPHAGLREHCSPGRACDAPVEAVDEQELEDDIRHVRPDDDQQRRAQVGEPAEVARAAERQEGEGKAECRDAQVGLGELGGLPLAADQGDEAGGEAAVSAATTQPNASESQRACAPSRPADSRSPAPLARATCAVVPYWRKLKIAKTAVRIVAAMPSAASCERPRCPTIAVSTRT